MLGRAEMAATFPRFPTTDRRPPDGDLARTHIAPVSARPSFSRDRHTRRSVVEDPHRAGLGKTIITPRQASHTDGRRYLSVEEFLEERLLPLLGLAAVVVVVGMTAVGAARILEAHPRLVGVALVGVALVVETG